MRGALSPASTVATETLGVAIKSSRWRWFTRLALATAVLQLFFWFGVHPLLFSKPTLPPLYAISAVEEATLTDLSDSTLAQAKFTPTKLPWSSCCGPGYRALRFQLDIPAVPKHGVALVPNVEADNLQVRINGHIVDARGRMALPAPTYEANVRRVIFISSAAFRAGLNQVEFVMVRQVLPYFDVVKPVFADFAVTWPMFKFREFMLTNYEMIGAALGAAIALVATTLLLRSSQRGLAWSLLALASSWALLNQFYFWVDPPFSANARMLYYFALTNLIPVAWLNFSDQWSRRPFRWTAPVSVIAYVFCMALVFWSLRALPAPVGFDRASSISNWYGLILSAATILRFLWHVVANNEDRILEFAVFVLMVTLLATDMINELLWHIAAGYVVRSMPLLLLAFLAAFLARNIQLFQSTHEINQLLRIRLEAREAELAETHQRESDLVRREAHQAERQRLMRDMHDGVGSQLTTMLFAARRGALPADQLADSLQTVIDEIRLLIDSMDSASDSLAGTLDSFQRRAAQRLEAAGVTLTVQPVPRDVLPAYGPSAVLQVMRILQEALSNSLRHAACSNIAIEISATGDNKFPAQLVIRDNGKGFSDNAPRGRGLANMETRAAAIGGLLSIDRTGPGVSVRLLLPASQTAEPQ